MFFWPCIMNWLYINYQLWCPDYYLFIKYYSPLHVSSLKCSSSGGYICTHAAYGTVTLYESSWWPVGTQLEWELTVGGRLLVGRLKTPYQATFPPQSVLTLAAYRQATRHSYREWRYHMLLVYNYVLLKMSTWCSKHVEESSILWINNNQGIKCS